MNPGDYIVKGGTAYLKKNVRAQPSSVESIIDQLLHKPNPPESELFVGSKPPTDGEKVIEAIFERTKIVETAVGMSRVSRDKIQRLTDAILNNGFSLEKIKKLAALDTSESNVDYCWEIFNDAGITGVPTREEAEAVVVVARALLVHVSTHQEGQHPTLGAELKTPFQAWRVKEILGDFILRSEPILVGPAGFDSSRQVKEFYANFSITEIVLWNHDIWKAAVNGFDSFIDTPLTTDIINCAMPMFWQYDLPFNYSQSDPYGLISKGYECVGFVILPTLEDYIKLEFPPESEADFTPDPNDPNKGFVTVDTSKPGVRAAIAEARKNYAFDQALKFQKRGVNVGIVFMQIDGNGAPEVRFIKPVYEDELIKSPMIAMVLAGLKFLTLKYVAKDTVGISKKELKGDRPLFRQVRKGRVEVPPIKVINLRRPEKRERKEGSEESKGTRVYTCHFMVDPHWRKQWYPSLNQHRPKRILTYVKGDMDKPFKPPRKKVYKAVR